ncbi:MAG TPA: hypothetical protein VF219_10700 [Vicinamibacterales bacterium]
MTRTSMALSDVVSPDGVLLRERCKTQSTADPGRSRREEAGGEPQRKNGPHDDPRA